MKRKGKGADADGKRKRVRRRRRRRPDELLEGAPPLQEKKATLSKGDILALQKTKGNAYVQRLLAEREGKAGPAPGRLPEEMREKMERAFDQDFSTVEVEEEGERRAGGKLAETSGEKIRFAAGQYDPETDQGQALLGHELAHVVQQRRGRGTAAAAETTQTQSGALEGEAERSGRAAAKGQPAQVQGASAGVQAKDPTEKHKVDPEIRPTEFKLGKELKTLAKDQFEIYKNETLAQATESGQSDLQIKLNLQKAERFVEEMMEVIVESWDKWRNEAYFHGLQVVGSTATGAQGCLAGPEMKQLMKDAGMPATGNLATNLSEAISQGLGESWKKWQDNVTVPGLPLYPDFRSFSGSDAPPTASVPLPFMKFISREKRAMTGKMLTESFDKYYEGENPIAQGTLSTVAESIGQVFMIWLKSHMVQRIMGRGHVSGYSTTNTSGPVLGSADQDPPAMAL